jgi:coenzyme F420-reducing hydrogenase gamma subunit
MSPNKKKVKVAFFDFTSCEGCQIELTNYGQDAFLGLLEHIEIVEFREAMSEKTKEKIDISFIEGSFSREADRKRLEEIRERSGMVVAYGACAATGGINAMKNHKPDYSKCVYGKDSEMPHLASFKAQPISAAIKVDYAVGGCPMDKNELAYIISHVLHGKTPVIPNHPVCVECKLRETVCRYTQGDHCLGLVARAGCNAICPADGIPCEACRGFIDQPNQEALVKVLVEKGGLSPKRAAEKTRMFTANLRSDAQ